MVINDSGHLVYGTAGGLSSQAASLSSRFKTGASNLLDGKVSDKTLDFVGNWIDNNYKNIGNGTVATAKDMYGYYVTELFDVFGGDVGGNGQFDPYSEGGKAWFANVSKQYPDLTKKIISKVTEVEKGLSEGFYKEYLEPIVNMPYSTETDNPFKG